MKNKNVIGSVMGTHMNQQKTLSVERAEKFYHL